MKTLLKITSGIILFLTVFNFFSCKKNKFTTDSSVKVRFSQDSVLFDTVFTTIGSSTRNMRVINNNSQKIKISDIRLAGGSASAFKINVDGSPGHTFSDIEIAANDSIYIFIQVNVNPTNQNSPLIISDAIHFTTNGNLQTVQLEAWGQDAYYHYPTDAIKFQDGYFPYSLVSAQMNTVVTWPNDKPHVIYGYLVVDSTQKLIIPAGTRVYLNNRAGMWVFRYGEINVNGQKGNEVIFQGARREQEFTNEPGQWDRIWINEGSKKNVINYAIIKNGYIGIQAEVFGDTLGRGRLKVTNTQIHNMSKWGIYSLAYEIYGGNNVISNCQEHSLNILLGGKYTFIHCTFANFWDRDTREKTTININNHYETQLLPLDSCYFGNCIIDGKLSNEITLDLQADPTSTVVFSNSWMRCTDVSDQNRFINVRQGSELKYESVGAFNFQPMSTETLVKNFVHAKATADAMKFPFDLNTVPRNTNSVTVGAYEN